MLSVKVVRSCFLTPSLTRNGSRFASIETEAKKPAPFSFMEAARRRKIRQDLKPIPEDDADFIEYPRERLGNFYHVNWALHKHTVAPVGGDAFRNLHVRGLQQRVPRDPPAATGAEHQHYNVAPLAKPEENLIGSNHIRVLHRQVTDHLSDHDIFAHDGAFGGDRHSEAKVRVITNCAKTGLLLRDVVSRVPLTTDMRDFEPEFVVYHVSSLPKFKSDAVGTKSGQFSVYYKAKKHVYIVGDASEKVLRDALSAAYTDVEAAREAAKAPPAHAAGAPTPAK